MVNIRPRQSVHLYRSVSGLRHVQGQIRKQKKLLKQLVEPGFRAKGVVHRYYGIVYIVLLLPRHFL